MKYLLIALAVTAISAEFLDEAGLVDDPSLDEFLETESESEMFLPCVPKPCTPVCKEVTKYIVHGSFKLPYKENVCQPDYKCLAAAAACQKKLMAAMIDADKKGKALEAASKAKNAAHASHAAKVKAANAKKAEAAAARTSMGLAKASFVAAEKDAANAKAAKESATKLYAAKAKVMDARLKDYEKLQQAHKNAAAAYDGAKSAAAKAAALYAAAVKAHCDAEAQHAAAVKTIGHGQLAQKNCAKYAPSTGTSLGAAGKLVKGKLVKSGMTLPKAYTLTFDITLKGKVGNWGSVFHFTTGSNCCGYGSRVPAMWFRPNSNQFIVVDGTKKSGNLHNTQGTLTIGKKYSVKMVASSNGFDTYLNGKKTGHLSRGGVSRESLKNLKMYMTDPWYSAANAVVSAITITPN